MTRVKGTAVSATLQFVSQKFGPEALNTVLQGLERDARDTVMGANLLASSWYPLSLLVHLMRVTDRQFGEGQPGLYREMGAASADYALTTIYRVFLRVGSPHLLIAAGPYVFKSYYEPGELRLLANDKGHAVAEVDGVEGGGPEFCERLAGWMGRMVELSGGEAVRVLHDPCRHQGGAVCRFEGYWN